MNDKDYEKIMEEAVKAAEEAKKKRTVQVINYEDNQFAVIGMFLVTHEDENLIDKYADMSNVYDKSILMFENRHRYEILQVILGMANMFNVQIGDATGFASAMFAAQIIEKCTYCKTYGEIKDQVDDLVEYHLRMVIDDKVRERFKNILNKIWFVSYASFDALAKLAIEEYEKEAKKNDSNDAEQD